MDSPLRKNDQNFARKLYRQHGEQPHFTADNTHQASHLFVIHHYAAQVVYDTFGFCDKNKDVLCSELINFIKRSTKPFIASLITVTSRNRNLMIARSRRMQDSRQAGNNGSGTNRCSLGTPIWNQLKQLLHTFGLLSCDISSQTTPQHFPSIFQTCLRSATCQRCA